MGIVSRIEVPSLHLRVSRLVQLGVPNVLSVMKEERWYTLQTVCHSSTTVHFQATKMNYYNTESMERKMVDIHPYNVSNMDTVSSS
jgi:hypothetical protein